MKTQSSIEYISIFAGALIVVVIVIAIVSSFLFNGKTQTYTPSSCYISPQINCIQLSVASNGIATKAIIVFVNNLGQTIHFSANSFIITPTYSTTSYAGLCFPVNALPGAAVVCNATLPSYNPAFGTQINPRFQITYSQCKGNNCKITVGTYNTVGSGTIYISPGVSSIYQVRLISAPYGVNGMITLNGVEYQTNTIVDFFRGASYIIYADPPQGYTFSSWTTYPSVGAVTISSQNSQYFATAIANGNIIANFMQGSVPPLTPVVTLSVQSAYYAFGGGQPDTATGKTTNTMDGVSIHCLATSGGPCSSSTLSAGTGTTTTAAGVIPGLPIGTYQLQACDTTYNPTQCSANVILQVVNSYLLTISSPVITDGTTPSGILSVVSSITPEPQGSVVTLSVPTPVTGSGYDYQFAYFNGNCFGSSTNSCPSTSYYSGTTNGGGITMYGSLTETPYFTGNYAATLGSNCNDFGFAPVQPCPAIGSESGTSVTNGGVTYFEPGTTVTLTATSGAPYYSFVGWNGIGTGSYNSINSALTQTFTMPTDPVNEIATYNIQTDAVTVTFNPAAAAGGWQVCIGPSAATKTCNSVGQSSFSATYAYGTTLNYVCTTLAFNPTIGYGFNSFSNAYVSTNMCNSAAGVLVNAPLSITANYNACYQLTLASSPVGTGTESAYPYNSIGCSPGYYTVGQAMSITASANSGYAFGSWTGSGITGSTANPVSFTMPGSATTVTANYNACYSLTPTASPGAGGTEAPSPANSAGCPLNTYISGTSVTVTATPNSGYVFGSWTGTGSGSYTGTSNPDTITMPSNPVTEQANYNACYQLTLASSPVGTGTESAYPYNSIGCSLGYYTVGQAMSITASANSGYAFGSWTGSGITGSTANPVSFTMPGSATTVTANYNTCYLLTLTGTSGGTQSKSPSSSVGCPPDTYISGTSVTISATPNSGYAFGSWTGTGSGSYTGTSNPYTVTMPSNPVTEQANYNLIIYSVTMAPSPSGGQASGASVYVPGGASVSGSGTLVLSGLTWGQTVCLHALPASGYAFTGYSGYPADTQSGGACSGNYGWIVSGSSSGNADYQQVYAAYAYISQDSGSSCSPDKYGNSAFLWNGAGVSPSSGEYEGSYPNGAVINIAANPTVYLSDGSVCIFHYWNVLSATTANPNTASTTITVDGGGTVSVTAEYTHCYYLSILPGANANGYLLTGISPTGTADCASLGGGWYDSSASVSFDITPGPGYTQLPGFPCAPSFAVSGTVNLCANAGGTSTAGYVIGMSIAQMVTEYANFQGGGYYAICTSSTDCTDSCDGTNGWYCESSASSSECASGYQEIYTSCYISGGLYYWTAGFTDDGTDTASDACSYYSPSNAC